mmetsp:Transcript_19516/g.27385  ORF Transcript_19516/g.27385 Transcript_19516/m.27385 type:complete len:152 (-) Transcript_19516:240-695(-)
MHYYKDGRSDQQALASLKDFSEWTASPVVVANEWLNANGLKGKVGDRAIFPWKGQNWFVVEAQKKLDDWSSWCVLVGDGLGYTPANLHTPHKSSSFANPFVGQGSTDGEFVAAVFIPREGSGEAEAGTLVYTFSPSDEKEEDEEEDEEKKE